MAIAGISVVLRLLTGEKLELGEEVPAVVINLGILILLKTLIEVASVNPAYLGVVVDCVLVLLLAGSDDPVGVTLGLKKLGLLKDGRLENMDGFVVVAVV